MRFKSRSKTPYKNVLITIISWGMILYEQLFSNRKKKLALSWFVTYENAMFFVLESLAQLIVHFSVLSRYHTQNIKLRHT